MISVVIPLYNKEKSIVRTLESVKAQAFTDYECIIVNDGSTDHSAQVVEQWLHTLDSSSISDATSNVVTPIKQLCCPSIRLINQPNGGVSSARNRGIEEAQGNYIAFLDGDDLWAPTYLEEVAKLISDCPDANLYCMGYYEMFDDGRLVEVGKISPKFNGYLEHPWQGEYGFATGSTAICRRDVLKEIGGFDTRMTHGEDLDVWWHLLLRGKGACCGKRLAFYRQDGENRAMNRVIPLEKHIPYFIDKFADDRAKNAEFRKYFDMQMVYRLFPYLLDKQYKKEAKRLADLLDYSQLKWSMHLRMQWPHIYRIYEKLKSFL